MQPFDVWLGLFAFICILGVGEAFLARHPEFTERWARRLFG